MLVLLLDVGQCVFALSEQYKAGDKGTYFEPAIWHIVCLFFIKTIQEYMYVFFILFVVQL